ncbi:hypothetical protein QM637_06090 [Pantoea allii]|uniref:nSTAND3 domain-containing NTPase n=1 Tax=Pantoea allii TaxID=574096 RepID=UPI0024B6EA31|nr:hypothetical protein [Pantoea allii]MDJ0035404.1 hypothetical protein [Pantoea allii]
MSIEITGPAKYDFQDLACIYIILKMWDKPNLTVFVEPPEGEDASIKYDWSNQQVHIEMQVKGAESPSDLSILADYLAHFAKRSDTDFLLKRIMDNSAGHVLFILSGRVSNELTKYLLKLGDGSHLGNFGGFVNSDAEDLLDALKKHAASLKASALYNRRRVSLDDFIDSCSPSDLKNALNRIVLHEMVDSDYLKDACRQFLRARFVIPDDHFDAVMFRIIAQIKHAKNNATEARSLLVSVFDTLSFTSLLPARYVLRGDEQSFLQILKTENILLLSGQPRMGKSRLAKWIAAEYQKMGYHALSVYDTDEARRFLANPAEGPRLVVLDDPLGGSRRVEMPREKLRILRTLTEQANFNRKVIIAQGQEILLEATDAESLNGLRIGQSTWHDLSHPPVKFLLSCWDALHKQFGFSVQMFTTIHDAISSGQCMPEPGCLEFLAAGHEQVSDTLNSEELLRFARRDARSLGEVLEESGHGPLLQGLSLTTHSFYGATETDLAYVLSGGEQELYAVTNGRGITYTLGGEGDPKPEFPQYETIPVLSNDQVLQVEQLELRRMLAIDDGTRMNFTHPFYRAAADSLIKTSTARQTAHVLKTLEKGLFSLSPIMSKAAALNISWIFAELKRPKDKTALTELAIKGLDCSYPATRDYCFNFLINNLHELPESIQNVIPNWMHKVNMESLSAFLWRAGEPYYPMKEGSLISHSIVLRATSVISEDQLEILNTGMLTDVTPQNIYDLLCHYSANVEEFSQLAIQTLLTTDVGILRAYAVKVWMRIPRENDTTVLFRIFNDTHPAVAESFLNGVIYSWSAQPQAKQAELLGGLIKMAQNSVCSLVFLNKLTYFYKGDDQKVMSAWPIFVYLFPEVLKNLPEGVYIIWINLVHAIEECQRVTDDKGMAPVIKSWVYATVNYSISYFSNHTSLFVTEHLLKNSALIQSERYTLIQVLLSVNNTAHLSRVLTDLVEYWSLLEKGEKQLILDLLTSDRPDRDWLHAVLFVTLSFTNEVQSVIFDGILMEKMSAIDILALPETLLHHSLMILIRPPTDCLHRIEINEVWQKVISDIALNCHHPMFLICLESLLLRKVNDLALEAIKSGSVTQAESIFDLMLSEFWSIESADASKLWLALFERAGDDAIRQVWFKRIMANSMRNDLIQLIRYMPDKYIVQILKTLESDYLIIEMLRWRSENSVVNEVFELSDNFRKAIMAIFDNKPPEHYSTCDWLIGYLREEPESEYETNKVELQRKNILKTPYVPNYRKSDYTYPDWTG